MIAIMNKMSHYMLYIIFIYVYNNNSNQIQLKNKTTAITKLKIHILSNGV